MSNKIKYRVFSILYGVFRNKVFRHRKMAIGALIIASACTGGSVHNAKKSEQIISQLKVIEKPRQDSIVLIDSVEYTTPVMKVDSYPTDCYAEIAPIMCYDQPAEPTCYDVVVPEDE
ncbi:MAG: hypothetical protein C0592_13985 [Marinilabiliales bacterium]|nr:MAG: hypothetical protein C0592_13985 [Marinilabiliales bacterium]